MITDNSSAMQDALAAAVKRMNNNSTAPDFSMPSDPISMLMTIIPKLLNNNDDRDDQVDKADALTKEDFLALCGDVQMLRKQIHRIGRLQEETLVQLREMQQHQVTLTEAVLDMAAQMSRVELMSDVPPESDELKHAVAQSRRPRNTEARLDRKANPQRTSK
ncbi:MAG: hypothetical protein SF187_04475 [Deltaproteobacteria bacterium]|nr:hypothetical protein [Deltaproteobacteria bacterium]